MLALPLDIANTKVDGGLRIDVVWQILYTTIAVRAPQSGRPAALPRAHAVTRAALTRRDATRTSRRGTLLALPLRVDAHARSDAQIWCIAVIPFAIFFYESEDPEGKKSALFTALKWTIASTVVALLATFIMWALLGTAEIPVSLYQAPASLLMPASAPVPDPVCVADEVRARRLRARAAHCVALRVCAARAERAHRPRLAVRCAACRACSARGSRRCSRSA